MRAAGIEAKLAPTAGPGAARELAQAAVSRGDTLVLACGGDGTVNEVINGLTPGQVTLGILPGGTANIIAKELGLPHDPVRAAQELPRWSPRRIALGQVTWHGPGHRGGGAGRRNAEQTPGSEAERRYFMSVAGIGFDAYIIHKLSWDFKMSLGVVAYGLEGVRQALRYSFSPFACRMDDREIHATFAVVSRVSLYAGWLRLAPGASLFDPRFHALIFKSRGRWRYFLYAAAIVMRQHLRLGDVELVTGRKVVCSAAESGPPIYFELDGELVGELPATFEVVPDALTLLVPPSTQT